MKDVSHRLSKHGNMVKPSELAAALSCCERGRKQRLIDELPIKPDAR